MWFVCVITGSASDSCCAMGFSIAAFEVCVFRFGAGLASLSADAWDSESEETDLERALDLRLGCLWIWIWSGHWIRFVVWVELWATL